MKRLMGLLLAGIMLISMSTTAHAIDSASIATEYQRLIAEGTLGNDVSLDYWLKIKAQSSALEQMLEESEEFVCVYDSSDAAGTYSTYSMKTGDIFVTNGTSSYGLTGHAGISVSAVSILHIAGPGSNPALTSLSSWNDTYTSSGWTKVYRHSDRDVALAAGQWASSTYKSSNATYKITMDASTTNETYCSKIVWQAYYYGPSVAAATGSTWGIKLPYSLASDIPGASLVKTYE